MSYREMHGMGVLNRFLLMAFLVVNTGACITLGAVGYVKPDPHGMVWVAIAAFLGLITWMIILVDSQNPYGVL